MPHAAKDHHDEDFGRLRPVGEVREDPAIEDAEQRAGETREGARHHECCELVAPYVDPDEFGALGVLADCRQHAAERRADDALEQHEGNDQSTRAR